VGFIIKMAVNERKRKLNSTDISILKEAELTAFQEKTVENSVADKSILFTVCFE
jgi:ferredoxin-fold anticodon binding domain-containing protein